jgi:glycosyltransferase involved in cell wall biosynthesis
MPKLIYIGNDLGKVTNYTPQLATLRDLLRMDGYEMVVASSKMNKVHRILNMMHTVLKHRKDSKLVLLDTFGASNFFFAVIISLQCRVIGIPYVPILRGGNLPDRFEKNPFWTRMLFGYSYKNVTPSKYLQAALKKVGYSGEVISNIIEIKNYTFKNRINYSPKLLYVRAFHEIYNPTMAIRVLERVQKKYPEAVLCMIGPPKDSSFKQTKLLAKELGLENSVTYTGVLSK